MHLKLEEVNREQTYKIHFKFKIKTLNLMKLYRRQWHGYRFFSLMAINFSSHSHLSVIICLQPFINKLCIRLNYLL